MNFVNFVVKKCDEVVGEVRGGIVGGKNGVRVFVEEVVGDLE